VIISKTTGTIVTKERVGVQRIKTVDEVREIFEGMEPCEFEMNWLFCSTSGAHGSYCTLDDVEARWDEDEAADHGHLLTVLVVCPRLVLVGYGDVEIERSDIPWLRQAVSGTLVGVSGSQQGNTR